MAPVASARVQRTTRASMKTLPNGDCMIVHREYFADVLAGSSGPPTAFDNTVYPINPGQVAMFPWLSKIAANFESYEFQKLQFEYETDAATSLAGTVILAVDYDSSDAPAIDKRQAQAFRGTVKSAPWQENTHISVTEDLKKLKSHYVRPGLQPANTDIKTYDIGNLQVITQGVSTSGALCGEMYVCYSIKLMTPVYENLAASPGGSFTGGGTQSAANPFGDAPVANSANSGILLNGSSVLYFQNPGEYLVTLLIEGTVITGFSHTDGTGATSNQLLVNVDGTSTIVIAVYSVITTVGGAVVSFAATATTITSATALIGAAPLSSL